tara:strand:- start:4555 stop:4845 length:291 start_codon:yes stop_codon:yes gene_type:complete
MSTALNVWYWIRNIEKRYYGLPIPEECCFELTNKLYDVMPQLKTKHLPKYDGIINDSFLLNFQQKLIKQVDNRTMLFDFIKNLIHENLLDGREDIK